MSIQEFWMSVRAGARSFAVNVVVDSPQQISASIERSFRSANMWLTPAVVDGFQLEDFAFLPDGGRELGKLVLEFREISNRVDPRGRATEEQVESAQPRFQKIIEILEFRRYGDAEAFRIGKQMEKLLEPFRPDALAELRFRTGRDHSGDPALWIEVYLTPEASASDDTFLSQAKELRGLIEPIANRVAPGRWPYVSSRSIADQPEAIGAS